MIKNATFTSVRDGEYENMEEKELTCKCGNDTFSEGFFPCDENGNEMEPTIDSDWNGTYVCAKCGKIHRME